LKSAKKSTDKFFVQSINRAFSIVDEVGRANERGLSLSEIAEKIDLPVSTVYRIIQNLIQWQYLAERDDGTYTLGFAFLTLGNIVKENLKLTNIARKHMEELNLVTSETIYLAMLDSQNCEVIYIDKVESRRNIKLAAGVGSRNFIHATANGKCLVSRLSKDKIKRMLDTKGMPALTQYTLTDVQAFLKEIEKVNTCGFALDDLENELGVRCVAAPVFDYTGKVVAAISISGIEANMDLERLNGEYSALVRDTALKISQRMGYDESK
jgi:DNA-binding IclR family transcriptional regulator